ncbi:hypothetical protein L7F22_067324 [Adiantum nelumboides]|nr:hypothetical protein [Adiantum nelumboides]
MSAVQDKEAGHEVEPRPTNPSLEDETKEQEKIGPDLDALTQPKAHPVAHPEDDPHSAPHGEDDDDGLDDEDVKFNVIKKHEDEEKDDDY